MLMIPPPNQKAQSKTRLSQIKMGAKALGCSVAFCRHHRFQGGNHGFEAAEFTQRSVVIDIFAILILDAFFVI